jgi:hypothetical protein
MHAAHNPEQLFAEREGSRWKIRRAEKGERPFDHSQDAGNFPI